MAAVCVDTCTREPVSVDILDKTDLHLTMCFITELYFKSIHVFFVCEVRLYTGSHNGLRLLTLCVRVCVCVYLYFV